jgi:hypothetical protein
MSPLTLLSVFRSRGSLATLFGLVLLSTLWVTSLTMLSSRQNATDFVKYAGAQVLNPFLAQQGFGITSSTYTSLQTTAKAHPTQQLSLPLLKAHVLGSDIKDKSYSDGVLVIYGAVAATYYDNGAGAVFDLSTLPAQLKDILPYFGLFNSTSLPITPDATTPVQLPPFLQPFFTVVGLTPDTFTAAGNQRLLDLLPWFWLATLVLGALTIIFNRSPQKLSGLAHGIIHSTWPVVGLLVVLWIASVIPQYKATFSPYAGVLGVVERSFLPIYGSALVLGFATLYVPRLLAMRRATPAGEPALASVAMQTPTSSPFASDSFGSAAAPQPFDAPSEGASYGGDGQ